MQKDVAGYKFSRPDVQDPNEVYTEICDSTMDISWVGS